MTPTNTAEPRPEGETKSTGGLNLRTVLSAVRRHPLAFAGVVLLAASAGAGVWFFLPLPKVAAAMVFHISPDPNNVIYETSRINYDSYRRQQFALAKSRRTLNEILKDPAVKSLTIIPPHADGVQWLDGWLNVAASGPEYMRIMVEGDDEAQLLALVKAAGRVYLAVSTAQDNRERNDRQDRLLKTVAAAEDELKSYRKRIDDIAVLLGSKDGAVLAIKDQFDQARLQTQVTTLAVLQDDLKNAQAELAVAKEQAKNAARRPAIMAVTGATAVATAFRGAGYIPPSVIDNTLAQDKHLAELEAAAEDARGKKDATEKSLSDALREKNPIVIKLRAAYAEAVKQRNQYRQEARARIEDQVREKYERDAEGMVAAAQGEFDRIWREIGKGEVRQKDLEARMLERNRYKIQLENLQKDIAIREQTAAMVAMELEKLRVEGRVPARVTVAEEEFVVPGIEGNRRLKFALMGTLGLFVAGFGGLVLWEYRGRRVTHVDDVSANLAVRLVGTIPPLVPSEPGAASGDAHAILVESIDTARNMLMHGTPGGADARVVLVTSAVSGEGKTTLSGHLAISLTRAGFRTLLVDGDIHAPSAHLLFGLPDAPGLSEVLRGEVGIGTAVRPSPVAGLSVLPAGKWTMATRQALVGERWRHLKHELKAQFDFVVVDTSPLLLVSDTMLLAREADTVVLSVMMGVSQVSRVADTIHRLGAVGAELAGVVVNNVKSEVYEYGYAYRSKYPAAPSSPAALPGAALAAAGDHTREG